MVTLTQLQSQGDLFVRQVVQWCSFLCAHSGYGNEEKHVCVNFLSSLLVWWRDGDLLFHEEIHRMIWEYFQCVLMVQIPYMHCFMQKCTFLSL